MSDAEPAAETVARLRARLLSVLDPLVPAGSAVVLVGSGLRNVGDCALAVATRAWLSRRGCAPRLEVDRRTYDRDVVRRRLGGYGILVLAGGGTVGDVWRSQEALRRRVLADFPAHRTVQLPQTVHFESERAVEEARAVYGGRPRLTVLTRDAESLAIARDRWGADAALAPDMALLLDVPPPRAPTRDALWLLRGDQQSTRVTAEGTLAPSPVAESLDWPPPRATWRRGLRRLLARSLLGADAPRRRAAIARADEAETRERADAGLALVGSARVVATDRLHGAILSLLLGVPVVALPDAHGKLASFHRTWTAGADGITWCETIAEAHAAVEARLARRSPALARG